MLDGLLTENSPTSAFFTTSSYLKDQILTSLINLFPEGSNNTPLPDSGGILLHTTTQIMSLSGTAKLLEQLEPTGMSIICTWSSEKSRSLSPFLGSKVSFSKSDRQRGKVQKRLLRAIPDRHAQGAWAGWGLPLPMQSLPRELWKALVSSLGFGHQKLKGSRRKRYRFETGNCSQGETRGLSAFLLPQANPITPRSLSV